MDNEEYAELLEKVAARLRKLDKPISEKTISAIGELARDVIGEGRKIVLNDSAKKDGIKGVSVEKIQEPTPEYQKVIDEADKAIEEAHYSQAKAIVNSKDFIAR